jgi:hypothetical protein
LTYRNSLLVAAATGFGLSVSAPPVQAASRHTLPGYQSDILAAKMVMPLRRLMPAGHKADSASSTVNTNSNTNAESRFANGTETKN